LRVRTIFVDVAAVTSMVTFVVTTLRTASPSTREMPLTGAVRTCCFWGFAPISGDPVVKYTIAP